MASISITRSVLPSSIAAASNKMQQQLLVPAYSYLPGVTTTRRSSSFNFRCMAANKKLDGKKVTSAAPTGSNIPTTPPPPPAAPKVSTKFTDVLAFSGPAPERINGRLAMIGFVAAIAVELNSGQDLVSQINGAGLPWFVYMSVLLSAASLVPLFSGVRAESVTKGLMNANAELWNGRIAMLGLVALAITEYVKGTTLI